MEIITDIIHRSEDPWDSASSATLQLLLFYLSFMSCQSVFSRVSLVSSNIGGFAILPFVLPGTF